MQTLILSNLKPTDAWEAENASNEIAVKRINSTSRRLLQFKNLNRSNPDAFPKEILAALHTLESLIYPEKWVNHHCSATGWLRPASFCFKSSKLTQYLSTHTAVPFPDDKLAQGKYQQGELDYFTPVWDDVPNSCPFFFKPYCSTDSSTATSRRAQKLTPQ